MEYHLRFSINYDEEHWNQETFPEDKRDFYQKFIEKARYRDAKIEDWYIEFHNGTPELASQIKTAIEKDGYKFDLWVFPCYTKEEIATARYVPLASRDDVIDMDESGKLLNEYREILCTACGRANDSNVPNPYRIYNKRVKQPRDLFVAMNGINILSILAFELLRSDIEPYVDFGQVKIVDKHRKPVENSYEYVWVRPKFEVGWFTNAVVKRTCDKCGSPTEIRMERSADIFDADKWVVESFKNTKAPIVLAGNWYGEVYPNGIVDFSRYVFISGNLHEKMRKLKLKGFIKSDCVAHAADEPYNWDPLKDRPSSDKPVRYK